MSARAPSLINSPPLLLVKVGVACPCPLALAPRPTPSSSSLLLRANSLYSRRREGGNAFSSAGGNTVERMRRRQREDRNVPWHRRTIESDGRGWLRGREEEGASVKLDLKLRSYRLHVPISTLIYNIINY